jgi:hypothetical protein
MSEEEAPPSNLLQVLNSWKDSAGVMVFVQWASGDGELLIRFRAYVVDATENEIHFGTDEDKGNVNMYVSLAKSTVARMDKRSVDLTFGSAAKLSMTVVAM